MSKRNQDGSNNPNYKGSNKLLYQDNLITKFLIESPKYGNKECIIDTKYWIKIKNYRWGISYGKKANIFYVVTYGMTTKNNRSPKTLHRFILSLNPSKMVVDHKNHDGLDNRESNIRICTSAQNNCNILRRNSIHKYKGVRFVYGKYRARIRYNNKEFSLGAYNTPEEAAQKYNEAALKYHKEFAFLNIIN
jgi:hypothetical protein